MFQPPRGLRQSRSRLLASSSLGLLRNNAYNNVTPGIAALVGQNLLSRPGHPLAIVRAQIEAAFPAFVCERGLSPVVSTKQCFDDLLIPRDHVSRRPSDTFYIDQELILRTHTSAHQTEMLRRGERAFLVSGDVFRRDSIDASHFPAFHQMEGVCVLAESTTREEAFADLKSHLDRLALGLFGPGCERRWVDTTFPFTSPSTEMEIRFNGRNDWLEVLGCGVVQPAIMHACGLPGRSAWAFGLGLERLAMIMFDIPDIRLFWTRDARFTSQFENGLEALRAGRKLTFQPYSRHPSVQKDLSFWVSSRGGGGGMAEFNDNDLFSVVRETAGEDVECVTLVDSFVHPKTGRESRTFRVEYRCMERNLTHEEVNALQTRVREQVASILKVELR
jgi:phenylalanyl-tRNA synthetase alpha chain